MAKDNAGTIIAALALANTFAQIAAIYLDQAQQAGATPEQIAAKRAEAIAHLDKSAAALAADVPYSPVPPQA